MKSVEVIRLGAKRRGTEVLKPGTYDLCKDNEHVILRVRCVIETEETFARRPFYDSDTVQPRWQRTGYYIDTLKALPTWRQRLVAFVLFRAPPLPRAIAIISSRKA